MTTKQLRQIVPLNEIKILGHAMSLMRYREPAFWQHQLGVPAAKRAIRTATGYNWLQRNFNPNRLAMSAKKDLGVYGNKWMTRLRQARKGDLVPNLPFTRGLNMSTQSTPIGSGKLRTDKSKLSSGKTRKLTKAPVLGESSEDLERLIRGHKPMSEPTSEAREHFTEHATQYQIHVDEYNMGHVRGITRQVQRHHEREAEKHWKEIIDHHPTVVNKTPDLHKKICQANGVEEMDKIYDEAHK